MKMLQTPTARQQGFTLVELIVVIVILGILAATALPKFIDVSSDARKGVMQGVEAAMRGANTMLYGKAAAAGLVNTAAAASNKVTAIGTTEVLLDYGYAKDAENLKSVLELNPDADFALSTDKKYIYHTKSKDGAANTDTTKMCRVTYAAATASTSPTYTLAADGC